MTKRLLDVVIASALLLVLSALIIALALAIKLESRGPVFYRCRRTGLDGREFAVLKFRKMRTAVTGCPLTAAQDERFTRIGRFLARTKLDELPQLWNVLTGSMSLVGPRPEDPMFVDLRRWDYRSILRVKPGITGLSQLAFTRESEILDPDDRVGDYIRRVLPQKTRMDRLYASRRSTAMDFRILGWTLIAILLRKEVAVGRTTGRLTLRRRPPLPARESVPEGVLTR